MSWVVALSDYVVKGADAHGKEEAEMCVYFRRWGG